MPGDMNFYKLWAVLPILRYLISKIYLRHKRSDRTGGTEPMLLADFENQFGVKERFFQSVDNIPWCLNGTQVVDS